METRKRSGKGVVLGLLALLFLGAAAQGELITIAIEAVVNIAEDDGNYLEGKVNVGDVITGYYTYDLSTPDSYPTDDNRGRYEHSQSPCGIFLSVEGIDFQTDLSDIDFIVIANNNYNSRDSYIVVSDNNTSSNGTSPDFIVWNLKDYTETALQDDSLPTTAPVLSQWNSFNHLRIEADRKYRIDATVTSAVLIPEPMTVILFGLGGLFIKRR